MKVVVGRTFMNYTKTWQHFSLPIDKVPVILQ